MREKIEAVMVVWRGSCCCCGSGGGDGDCGSSGVVGDGGVVVVEVEVGVGVGVEEVVSRAEGDGCCYERTGGEWRTSS